MDVHSLTQSERNSLLYCELYYSDQIWKIKDFEALFDVSRFTVIDDINALKEVLVRFSLEMVYDNKLGYTLVGEEYAKRRAFYYFFSAVYEIIKKQEYLMSSFTFLNEDVYAHAKRLKKIESSGTGYYECSILALACVLSNILKSHTMQFHMDDVLPNEVIAKELAFVKAEYAILPDVEIRYFAACLYCSSISRSGFFNDKKHLETLARKMNDIFYLFSTIKFDDDKDFLSLLMKHLDISFLRYQYGISIDNPLIDELKANYGLYFDIAKQAVKVIELETDIPINDNEIGFLVLYYAGYTKKMEKEIPKIRAVLICANGVSSSYLLKHEIERLDSRIVIEECMSIQEYHEQGAQGELVITNLEGEEFKDQENVIWIHTFLRDEDRMSISNKVSKILFQKSADVLDEDGMNHLITEYEATNHDYMDKMDHSAFINHSDVFKPEFVRMQKTQDMSWQELIRYAAEPLIVQGYIGEAYYKQIIENIEKYGSYMVFRNGCLLGHASMELSQKLGLSFLKLHQEMDVKGAQVSKIFIFTPINKKDHIPILTSLTTLLESNEIDQMLVDAQNEMELYNIIMSVISAC